MKGILFALKGWAGSWISIQIGAYSSAHYIETDVMTLREFGEALSTWIRSSARPWAGIVTWCDYTLTGTATGGFALSLTLSGTTTTFTTLTPTSGNILTFCPYINGLSAAMGAHYVDVDHTGWSRWDQSPGAISGAGQAWSMGASRWAPRRPQVQFVLDPVGLIALEAASRWWPQASPYAEVWDGYTGSWRAVTIGKVSADPDSDLTMVGLEVLASGEAVEPADTWGTGYLNGNGTVNAKALGALVGVDSSGATWTMINLIQVPTASSRAGSAMLGGTQLMQQYITTAGAIQSAINVGGWVSATTTIPSPTGLLACSSTILRPANQVRSVGASTGGASATVLGTAGTESTYATDVWLASLGGAGMFYGRLYGSVIYLGTPTAMQTWALALGHNPWDVLTPSLIKHAWNPADAYEGTSTGIPMVGGGYYWIPDVAPERGGNVAAVHAQIVGGTLANVIR